jgi:outer membrane receptor protein involved in Fe transport
VAADPVFTYQNRNVGRVKNTGVELEASAALGMLDVRGQYAYVRSRVQDPGAATGDLLPGDELFNIPSHTGGISVSLAPRAGTTITAGATYVGQWLGYDIPTLYSCFAGTGPCLPGPGLRLYRTKLPSLTKVNATVSQQITPGLTGFVSVDNLTNNTKQEFVLFNAVMGRITTVGLQFHR